MTKILEVPLYSMYEAARLLKLDGQKLKRWLEGACISERDYPPVLREHSTGSDAVTWAEFIEAGLLKEYRGKQVSLQHLRRFIEHLRGSYGVPYPLAHYKPLIDLSKRRLVMPIEEGVLAHWDTDQLQWERAAGSFLDKVEFDPDGVVDRFLPKGKASPVAIDPEIVFGIPQIRGIRTETLMEEFATGAGIHGIAEEWNLSVDDVEAALQFEASLRPARAA